MTKSIPRTPQQLIADIARWQEDDGHLGGYDTAIGLLCEARKQLEVLVAVRPLTDEARPSGTALDQIETSLKARRWVVTLCGQCGHRYRRCAACHVGVTNNLGESCGRHNSAPCTADCDIELALAEVERLRAVLPQPEPRHAWALRDMLKRIPQDTDLRANRYDTDDEHVLHVWNNAGQSFDVKLPKAREVDGRTPVSMTELERLLLALDERLDKTGPDDDLRRRIAEALQTENRRILAELDEAAAALPSAPAKEPPRCHICGKLATCIGEYETCTGNEQFACDECCGHGNEDGHCKPVAAPAKEQE